MKLVLPKFPQSCDMNCCVQVLMLQTKIQKLKKKTHANNAEQIEWKNKCRKNENLLINKSQKKLKQLYFRVQSSRSEARGGFWGKNCCVGNGPQRYGAY